ncbi:hypothetical protein OIU84_026236 [Salix udensis]|uniref:Uncharacterized protein n=1 Tax=Salix udensis TaxID=889485 RepID=A0AAD6PDK1_9ROSI|nr:hypothetical protein OIU84_026236 [Salix udensis]
MLEMECQDSDAFELDLVKLPLKKLEPEAPDKISTGRSTSISAEELSMVLKHYGLDCRTKSIYLLRLTLVLLAIGYHLLQEVEEELYLY